MASENPHPSMADDQYRGLLTEREREILQGNADVSENYRYRVISRVRTKLDALETDVEILGDHHPNLHTELSTTVCGERDSTQELQDRIRELEAELEDARNTSDNVDEARDAIRRALRDDAWGPVRDAASYLEVDDE